MEFAIGLQLGDCYYGSLFATRDTSKLERMIGGEEEKEQRRKTGRALEHFGVLGETRRDVSTQAPDSWAFRH